MDELQKQYQFCIETINELNHRMIDAIHSGNVHMARAYDLNRKRLNLDLHEVARKMKMMKSREIASSKQPNRGAMACALA